MTSRYAPPWVPLAARAGRRGETAHTTCRPQEIRRQLVAFLQKFQYLPVGRERVVLGRDEPEGVCRPRPSRAPVERALSGPRTERAARFRRCRPQALGFFSFLRASERRTRSSTDRASDYGSEG